VHASRGLLAVLLFGQWNDEFAPMAYAFLDRRVVSVNAVEFEEAGNLSHLTYLTRRTRSCSGAIGGWLTDGKAARAPRGAGMPVTRLLAWQLFCPWRARQARGGTRPASPCGIWASTRPSSPARGRRDASRQSGHAVRSIGAAAPRRNASCRRAHRH